MSCNLKNGISVILPAYNEEKYIGKVLTCLLQALQNSGVEYEVIVVDNGSKDSTKDIINTFPVKHINCEIKGAAACRNLGVTHVVFDKIAFLDSDCLVNDDWIINIQNRLSEEGIGAYGGPYLSPKEGTWVEKAWAPITITNHSCSLSLLPGGNFSVKTCVFIELDGFREDLLTAEDDDFSRRISLAGYDCVKDTQQSVIHLGYPNTLKDTFFKVLWHGKTQLRANGVFSDKMVMLTIVWLLFVLFSLLTFGNERLFILSTSFVFLILPALLVAKKLSSRAYTLYEASINYILAMVTLFARSIGLIIELYGMVKKAIFFTKETN